MGVVRAPRIVFMGYFSQLYNIYIYILYGYIYGISPIVLVYMGLGQYICSVWVINHLLSGMKIQVMSFHMIYSGLLSLPILDTLQKNKFFAG